MTDTKFDNWINWITDVLKTSGVENVIYDGDESMDKFLLNWYGGGEYYMIIKRMNGVLHVYTLLNLSDEDIYTIKNNSERQFPNIKINLSITDYAGALAYIDITPILT